MSKKMKELESLNDIELSKRLFDLKGELIKLNTQVATGTVPKNPTTIRNTRKTVARILMLMHSRQIDQKMQDLQKMKKTQKTQKAKKPAVKAKEAKK